MYKYLELGLLWGLVGVICILKDQIPLGIFSTIFAIYFINSFTEKREKQALEYIKNSLFPAEIKRKLLARYPHLKENQADRVLQGLRSYFRICRKYDRQTAMPSLVVDAAWHEFLLLSQDYTKFCQGAFGNYFHHVPTARLESPLAAQKILMNAWRRSCLEEGIDPYNPLHLPLLFALDAELAIADGVFYSIDAGIYPRRIEGIPPNQLLLEIEQKLPLNSSLVQQGSAKWEAEIDRLAAKIKIYLFNDNYCETYGRDALAPLFDSILAREDLTVALFGDIALAKVRLSKVRKLPPQPECGCSSSSG